MPTTIKNIKGTELPPSLRNRFNVKEHQFLTVTIEVEDDNMWDKVIESARQTHKDLKMGKPIPTIQDVFEKPLMYIIRPLAFFPRDLKKLKKKYPQIKTDLEPLIKKT